MKKLRITANDTKSLATKYSQAHFIYGNTEWFTAYRITSKEGVQLRINRSIQAEGAFAMMKADMNFRRFLSRGTANVLVEIMLLAMAYNIQKLHCKIQSDRAGQHLFPVNNAA